MTCTDSVIMICGRGDKGFLALVPDRRDSGLPSRKFHGI